VSKNNNLQSEPNQINIGGAYIDNKNEQKKD
jgi:hypothetical protein